MNCFEKFSLFSLCLFIWECASIPKHMFQLLFMNFKNFPTYSTSTQKGHQAPNTLPIELRNIRAYSIQLQPIVEQIKWGYPDLKGSTIGEFIPWKWIPTPTGQIWLQDIPSYVDLKSSLSFDIPSLSCYQIRALLDYNTWCDIWRRTDLLVCRRLCRSC